MKNREDVNPYGEHSEKVQPKSNCSPRRKKKKIGRAFRGKEIFKEIIYHLGLFQRW